MSSPLLGTGESVIAHHISMTLNNIWCNLSSKPRHMQNIEFTLLEKIGKYWYWCQRIPASVTPSWAFFPSILRLRSVWLPDLILTFIFIHTLLLISSFLMRQEIQADSGSQEIYFHTIIHIKKHLLSIQL